MNRGTFFICSWLILLSACKPEKPVAYRKLSGAAQGTTYHITYQDRKGRDLATPIDTILRNFDQIFSAYSANSLISRINSGDTTVRLTDSFLEVYHKAEEVYRETEGAMDLTVAPLVNFWGFGPEKGEGRDTLKLDSLRQLVGMEKMTLVGRKLVKSNPAMRLDVNSIAQGYSVDVICRYFDSLQLKNYMVEIGGEVRAKGVNPEGKIWRIGVDRPSTGNRPFGEDLQAVIRLESKAVTTSGNYRKFIEEDGKKFSHIIDPHTGYPYKNNLLSVTVIADDALTADGYDTGLMVLGLDKARVLLKRHPELQAILIFADEKGGIQVESTPGIPIEN